MTIFELVKITLDELYSQGQEQYGSSLDAAIKKQLTYLSRSYAQLNNPNRKPASYRDPATRFAYVYKYVAAHGDYIVQVMQFLKSALGEKIFAGENLRISCMGGGPGSDIIAILKFLEENKRTEPTKKIICYLLDKEQAWADTWTELDEKLSIGIALNTNFQPLDITDPNSWKLQKKFL